MTVRSNEREDRLLRLALEQELERPLDEPGRVGGARIEPGEIGRRHRHPVARRRATFRDPDRAAPAAIGRIARDVDRGHSASSLAVRAPERQPGQLDALAATLDQRAASSARTTGPAVDPQRLAGRRRVAVRRRPFRAAATVGVGEQQPSGGCDESSQGPVVQLADRRPRVDPLDEQDLALVDVADAGQRPLVDERLADRPTGTRWLAQPADRLDAPAGSKSGPSRSGPSRARAGWCASARISNSSTTGASKQTATAPGTSRTSRARPAGRRQRSPGR